MNDSSSNRRWQQQQRGKRQRRVTGKLPQLLTDIGHKKWKLIRQSVKTSSIELSNQLSREKLTTHNTHRHTHTQSVGQWAERKKERKKETRIDCGQKGVGREQKCLQSGRTTSKKSSQEQQRDKWTDRERGRERGRGVQTAQQLALFCRTSFYFFACFLASSVVKKQPTKRTANVDKDKQQTTQKERGRGEREEEGLSNMLIWPTVHANQRTLQMFFEFFFSFFFILYFISLQLFLGLRVPRPLLVPAACCSLPACHTSHLSMLILYLPCPAQPFLIIGHWGALWGAPRGLARQTRPAAIITRTK